jgi:methionyl-tRNA formyltransferase
MRVLFLGSPAPVVPVLERLVAAGLTIVGVVTQPDRPAGRDRRLTAPAVKTAALRLGLPILQPESLRDPVVVEQLQALQPDIGVVAAYGQILRRDVLAVPPLGYLNIHPSLLPHYRGPTPVTAAILAGDRDTGVTVMKLDRGMDTGPLLAQSVVPLPADARAGVLTDQLFLLGAELLVHVMPLYAAGSIAPQPQDNSQATLTRLLTKHDGLIDWSLPAIVIERMTRAFDPWPACSFTVDERPIQLVAARVVPDVEGLPPGTLIDRGRTGHPLVMTGSGALELLQLRPAGKQSMSGAAWWAGLRMPPLQLSAATAAPPLTRRVCDL